MVKHAICNGKVIFEAEAVLPITAREVQCNFSVYEALRVLSGHAVHLDDHYKRLCSSARDIGLTLGVGLDELKDSLAALIEADSLTDATIRILAVGGKVNTLFITWNPLLTYPDSYYTEGVAVTTYSGERFLPTCKTSNLLLSYLALENAKSQGAFEALLVNRYHQVLEGTRSNFYALKGNVLQTAPDDQVLSGVTRISVEKAAEELGLTIVFSSPDVAELSSYDALFLSSTSMAAMPISSVDGVSRHDDFSLVLKIKDYVRAHECD